MATAPPPPANPDSDSDASKRDESKRADKASPKSKPAVMTDAQAKELIRRIPLHEVLLEEYRTHNPAPDGRTQLSESEKQLEAERKKLEDESATLREKLEGVKDERERERIKARENDRLTRAFFTMLVKEQREQARAEFERLREEASGAESVADPDRAAVNEIFGFSRDEEARRKFEKRRRGLAEGDKEPPPGGDSSGGGGGPMGGDPSGEISNGPVADSAGAGGPSGGGGGTDGGGTDGGQSAEVENAAGNGGPAGGGGGSHKTPLQARQALARARRSALCLSGGGIRSATFNLGIIQGLARHGLLEKFDYLSTVSGGGFIGGWLSGWLHRQADPLLRDPDPPGMDPAEVTDVHRVVAQLKRKPTSPLEPEPAPIKHLRIYSNFLSPQTGLLSADTWTLVSTLLRNLLLTWLVFVPFVLVALLVPRAWMSFVTPRPEGAWFPLGWCFWIAVVAAWVALTYVGIALAKLRYPDPDAPAVERFTPQEKRFLQFCLLPGVISAASLAVYLRRLGSWLTERYDEYSWTDFLLYAALLLAVPWLLTVLFRFRRSRLEGEAGGGDEARRKSLKMRLLIASVLILLAQIITGVLLYVVVTQINPLLAPHPRLYAVLSVPLLLLVLMLDCALIAGFTSTLTEDEDMEWWARAGAWFFIVIVGWAVVHVLVLFGPEVIILLGRSLASASKAGFWTPETLKAAGQLVAVAGGLVSLVITLVGGFSAKSTAQGKEGAAQGGGSGLLAALAGLLGPISLAFLLIVMALGTNYLLAGIGGWLEGARWFTWPGWFASRLPDWSVLHGLQSSLARFDPISATDHEGIVRNTPLRLLLLVGALVGLVGLVMGLIINTNKFSLHYMWRNRIIRAYLGASNKHRRPDVFTNFDTDDNIPMHELRREQQDGDDGGGEDRGVVERGAAHREERPALPRKLFHVLNIALNLAGGDKLAWQDRKSESFTVSPLHCGSYWLDYRRSRVYGGENGISLGTAIAISGAFVSPNMGYMMTSPVVRFLMTLFNVRFGWWLGNPGPVGDNTPRLERLTSLVRRRLGRISAHPFESSSPALSVLPIVAEAFGKTDDTSPYVYLSDGGHFENLGLYEMVLRRCRFIVVSDASTDAGYSFDSLAQSIRQIRVDFGIPIDITDMSIIPPSDDRRGKYCAVGRIRYSCVDRDADNNPEHEGLSDEDFDGTLIYVKASMIGDEPRDVVNYGRGSGTFPQEIIVDQWFSEAQFESYRALGSHIIDALCSAGLGHTSDRHQVSFAEFEEKAHRHNQLHFGVFKERASYAALKNEFRRIMDDPQGLQEYRARVREYFSELTR